ncbi:transcriptional regulator [Rhodobacteraceae bacterium WD3A24]|nr:transcriptional regulator [Rhodobacteraceae bacterium WD3A24]
MTTSNKPYADTRLAKFLQKRILEMRPKTQNDIASEAGFIHTNMLTMIKQGASKLPLDRVPALAEALECDPRLLAKLALEQTAGATSVRAIEEIFGTVVTRNELAWIEELRDASDHADPSLTSRGRAAVRGIFGK